LRCIAPGVEPSLLAFYLRDLEEALERGEASEATSVLRTYGPQFQASEPREVLVPLTEELKLRLLARFALPAGAPKSVPASSAFQEARKTVEDSLREYVFRLKAPSGAEVF